MSKYLFLLLSLSLITGCTKDLRPRMAELEAELDAEKKLVQTLKTEIIEVESKLKKNESDYISLLSSSKKDSEIQQERMAVLNKENIALKEELRNANRNALSLKIEKSGLEADVALLNERILAFSKIEAEKRVEANANATLTVQVGVTMQSGDLKLDTYTKVYLTKRSSSDYLGDIEVVQNDGIKGTKSFRYIAWAKGLGEMSTWYSTFAQKAYDRLKSEAVAVSDTDFNGTASFENISKGNYYAICVTTLGGGAVLEKRISVSTSKVKVALSNADSLE